MDVIGFLWLLYPLLGLLGFAEFAVGLVHVFFCLPFFSFFVPMVSGITASITSMYALLLSYPNRCELTLQCLSVLFSFVLLLSSSTEAVCIRHVHGFNGTVSVCAGVLNRTLSSQQACGDVLGQFQNNFLSRIMHREPGSIGPAEDLATREELAWKIKMGVSTTLAVCALIHFCTGIVLASFSGIETEFRLSRTGWNSVFGLITLVVSYTYYAYCNVMFFTYYTTVVACYCIAQFAVPMFFTGNTTPRQLISVVGAALSTALTAGTSFGFYCWANRHADIDERAPGLYRFCMVSNKRYAFCHRTIEFSEPYIWWTPEQVSAETEVIQLIAYSLLTLTGTIHFFLFICDAFG